MAGIRNLDPDKIPKKPGTEIPSMPVPVYPRDYDLDEEIDYYRRQTSLSPIHTTYSNPKTEITMEIRISDREIGPMADFNSLEFDENGAAEVAEILAEQKLKKLIGEERMDNFTFFYTITNTWCGFHEVNIKITPI